MKFKSLIAGLLAGTALGILFSPDKGDKIRKDIKKEINKGGTGLSTIFGVYKKMGKEIGESAKETYENEEFQKKVEKVKKYGKKLVKDNVSAKYQKQAKGAFQKAKSAAKKAVKKVKEEIDKRSNCED